MSLLDALFKRRSVRRYKSEPVSEEVFGNIFEAGRLVPSADNAQPWHFVVVRDPKIKHALAQGRWNWFIEDSAFTVVGCGERSNRWSTVDVTIALENMVIAAEAQGVRSRWVGDFNEGEVKKLLRILDDLEVVALVSFGCPVEKPYLRSRKSLEEIVHYDRF
jgi:nitroreductase